MLEPTVCRAGSGTESISYARPCQSAFGKDLHSDAVVEQGTRYREKWFVSGDIIPSLTHLKCLDNSLHLMVPHCKHRGLGKK